MALSIALTEGALPTEFRIFKAGENTTSRGSYLFDEQAAKSVLDDFKEHGIDVMIDLEHLSIEDPQESRNFDPDARGWCKLEVRNGELWAVAVSWTADGAARLTDKRQRYISPVFTYDDAGRVTSILNIAITALPATDQLQPLVAASRRSRDHRTKLTAGTSFGDVMMALQDAVGQRLGFEAWIVDVFDTSLVYEFDGKLWELTYSLAGKVATLGANPVEVQRTYAPVAALPVPAPAPAPAAKARRQKLNAGEGENPMNPEQFAALAEALGLGADANVEDVLATVAAMVKKVQDAANGTPPANDTAAAETPAAASGTPAMVAAARLQTASRVLCRLSGKKEIGEVVREIETWHTSHLELETNRAKLAQERLTLEAGERHRLVVDLVRLGAEIPATAWADPLDPKEPAEPWKSMPLDKLRDRVAKLAKAKGTTPSSAPLRSLPRPAPGAGDDAAVSVVVDGTTVELTAGEVAACRDAGATHEAFARNKLIRLRAQGRTA